MSIFKRKKPPASGYSRPFCTAVVAAAGKSERMEGTDKLFAEINGKPVLAYTLEALQSSASIDEIVIATGADKIIYVYDICKAYNITKASKVIKGGSSRAESVLLALGERNSRARLAAVHDGARPLVEPSDIDLVVDMAVKYGAAILAVPLKDTIKEVKNGVVSHTPDRSRWQAAQTPQAFDAALLTSALKEAMSKNKPLTDDSMAVEMLGVPIHIVEGKDTNIKVTTPTDLALASVLLEERYAYRAGV